MGMEGKQSYRELVVWQRAMDLVPPIYDLVRAFPRHEQYALSDQIRRAVVSIPANVAEGQGRQHRKEFAQFLSVARGSLAELHTLLLVASRLDYITSEQLSQAEDLLSKVRRPLTGLITRITHQP